MEYIVENTLGPLIDEIKDDLLDYDNFADRFAERVFDLKVLDPAMGSGHFLVEAVDYLAREVVNAHEKQAKEEGGETIDETHDIHWARRQVAQNCIYGVDLNPMATELAKVSLWLRTLASEQPLAFLDHHLKTGNSLVGSDFEDIEEIEETSGDGRPETSLTDFGLTFKGTIDDLLKVYQEIMQIENEELSDIKKIEEKYSEIERNKIKNRLETILDIHTAQKFNIEVPEDTIKNLVSSIKDDKIWKKIKIEEWYKKVKETKQKHRFFNWQLEYPEVFFSEKNGFDAVIGNPPYVNVFNLPEDQRNYFNEQYFVNKNKTDLYAYFIEKSNSISENKIGFIVSNTWLSIDSFSKLRKLILKQLRIEKLSDLGSNVFEDATVSTMILILSQNEASDFKLVDIEESGKEIEQKVIPIDHCLNDNYIINLDIDKKTARIFDKIEKNRKLGDYANFSLGIKTADNDRFLSNQRTEKYTEPVLRGKEIERYWIESPSEYMWYSPEKMKERKGAGPRSRDFFDLHKKIVLQEISGESIVSAIDYDQRFPLDTVNVIYEIDKIRMENLVSILNSKLINLWYGSQYKGIHVKLNELARIPVTTGNKQLIESTKEIQGLKKEFKRINLNIKDYLGNYSIGKTINDLYTPVKGLSDTILTDTISEKDKLRIGDVEFQEKDSQLILKVTARYKPNEDEDFNQNGLDRWGYLETNFIPAMTFSGSDKELFLIREFTKLAINKGGGFANFRKTATKTKSLINRLEELTLPKIENVSTSLKKYMEQKEKAERLEKEIQEIDNEINAIVFDLYDLTKEEVKIVLNSLDTEEEVKEDIINKFIDLQGNSEET
ncbi:Type II restriction enzyme methylase subunit [Methanonatronarchaeum thermophilum]|uniref:site-specific DNA-methyltransferase (adenine-specific) n=1 Tax=Methanonatronarchaeum thermophilum TaxID=1927129 RepID=A0A1Y3GAM0_9EURY|nr:Type II restriction enzyme methylase subunit [Methanonatronarchaeum thermophilum]